MNVVHCAFHRAHERKREADAALLLASAEAERAAEAVRAADEAVARLESGNSDQHAEALSRFVRDENQLVCHPGLRMPWRDFQEMHRNYCVTHRLPYRPPIREDLVEPLILQGGNEARVEWPAGSGEFRTDERWVVGCDVAL